MNSYDIYIYAYLTILTIFQPIFPIICLNFSSKRIHIDVSHPKKKIIEI